MLPFDVVLQGRCQGDKNLPKALFLSAIVRVVNVQENVGGPFPPAIFLFSGPKGAPPRKMIFPPKSPLTAHPSLQVSNVVVMVVVIYNDIKMLCVEVEARRKLSSV